MRTDREKRTIEAMIELYCEGHHGGGKGRLCADCSGLLEYAWKRVDHCRFGVDKPVCGKCPVHCYKPGMKELAKEVMRWSGPRMLFRHPFLAVMHLVDARNSEAYIRKAGSSSR